MKRVTYLFLTLFLIFGIVLIFPSSVLATGKLTLEPVRSSLTVGSTLSVKIKIDTGTDKTTSADAWINYNSNQLEIVSIEDGGFYSNFFKKIFANKIYVGGAEVDSLSSKTGTGTLAILTIKGKQKGIAQLTFDCITGKTNDSNIIKDDVNATDIINCPATTGGSYTITAGISEKKTLSPTPSSLGTQPTPTPPLSPTASGLPLFFSLGAGIVLLTLVGLSFYFVKKRKKLEFF